MPPLCAMEYPEAESEIDPAVEVPAPAIVTVAVCGVPMVALPVAADSAIEKVLLPENGVAELIGTVLDMAKARRRRERWRYVSAAAAVVVLAGGLFGGLRSATSTTQKVFVPTGSEATWERVAGTSQATGVTATIAYTGEKWGHAFEVLVDRIPRGTTCQLMVVHPNGTRTQVAAWTTAGDEGSVWYAGSMPITAEPISSFQITADKKVLLTARPT